MKGIKHDSKKWRFSLFPIPSIMEVANVLEYGAAKYSPDNWKHVRPKKRYFDAALRHILAWGNGEKLDEETGYNHLAHAVCCLLYLIWHDLRGKKQ